MTVTEALADTPWWLSLIKAIAIFVFLVLSTLIMIGQSDEWLRVCSNGLVRTVLAPWVCCKGWPTASNWH